MALNRTIFQQEKNFWNQHKIKIASTLIAVLIWFLVVTGGSYEYDTTIPIEVAQYDPNFVLTSELPKKAHVILQGSGRHLFSFMLFRQVRLRLDINWTAGKQLVHPQKDHIFRSGNAKNLTIRQYLGPDSIQFEIEKRITVHIPVRNNVTIKPLAGYKIIGDITMEPESVRVQGPEKTLAQLDSIDTKSQTLDNEKFPIHKEFSLVQPNNKQITLLDSKVTIAADIQQLLEKVIPQVPVTVRYLPQNIEPLIHPPHISVKIQGGMQIVSPLDENDINAYVEYQPGSDSLLTSVPILIEPIAGVSIREKSSERVKITFLRNAEQ